MSGALTPTGSAPEAFTRGPWRVFGPQHDTLGGQSLTILAGYGKARFGVAQIRIILPSDASEASANAHLIAAAPDLYEAVDHFLHRVPIDPANREAFARLSDALAKARGDQ